MNKKGFTLIEAAISIAIIGAGMVGMLYAYQGVVRNSLIADQSVIAANIAREALEKISMRKMYDEFGPTLTAINTTGTYDENPVTGFAAYVLDCNAVQVNQDDDDNTDDFLDALGGSWVARVTCTVTWNGGNNNFKLVTLITDY
jgi:prepilin-type N-terminal cleavage/methylation domain-containing protein